MYIMDLILFPFSSLLSLLDNVSQYCFCQSQVQIWNQVSGGSFEYFLKLKSNYLQIGTSELPCFTQTRFYLHYQSNVKRRKQHCQRDNLSSYSLSVTCSSALPHSMVWMCTNHCWLDVYRLFFLLLTKFKLCSGVQPSRCALWFSWEATAAPAQKRLPALSQLC